MEFEKPRVQKVAEAVFDSYRTRLATELTTHGFTAAKIAEDTEMKTYINNWVQENVINHKERDAIVGITHKLAHMEVQGTAEFAGVYPIVHKYLWHNLTGSYVFYKGDDGTCQTTFISLEAPEIIVP